MPTNAMTSEAHWDDVWSRVPSLRLPTRLYVSTWDRMRLLRPFLKPGTRFLELGCAPGKMLAWVGSQGAEVTGIDYSHQGIDWSRQLMHALGVQADLRCEDLFSSTLPRGHFDVVHSAGLIEHFDDPMPLVRLHWELARPGGTVLISVPNYSGIYGWLARRFGPSNLALHNLTTTSLHGLQTILNQFPGCDGEVKLWGRCSASRVVFDERLPQAIAVLLEMTSNCLGLVQPWPSRWLSPQTVLRIVQPAR